MACCTGCSAGALASFFCAPYQAGSPSSVVTALPSTAETGVTQERVSTPLTSTEQEPHWAKPQPKRGPRNCSSFERTYSSGVSGADATVKDRSLTRILISRAMVLHYQTNNQSLRVSNTSSVAPAWAKLFRSAAAACPSGEAMAAWSASMLSNSTSAIKCGEMLPVTIFAGPEFTT